MRFIRIRLQNYRGVEDAEVSFTLQGVTIVQGPNEVGKTSIAEAISLILDEQDSSSKQKVRDIKPVQKDVGAEVELEFTTGPYHLRYAKRWNSRAMTTLEILTPAHENHTGRPAHERVRQILEETTDEALWRALRYEQGVAITQANLKESRSLAAALDAATSGSGVAPDGIEADLLDAVVAERLKYLTPTGRPTVDRTSLAAEVADLERGATDLKAQLDAVEEATERHRAVSAELRELTGQLEHQELAVTGLEADWTKMEELRRQVEYLLAGVESAAAKAEMARTTADARRELVGTVGARESDLAGLRVAAEQAAPTLDAAHRAREAAVQGLEEARSRREKAEEESRLARSDRDHYANVLDLELLGERLGRVRQAEKTIGDAETFLETCRIDAQSLSALQAAHLEMVKAEARASGDAPVLTLEALSDLNLRVDGASSALPAGTTTTFAVSDDLDLVIGDTAHLSITAAESGRTLAETAREAEARFADLCVTLALDSDDPLGQAQALDDQRKTFQSAKDQANATLTNDLRDLTVDTLAEKVTRLEERIAAFNETRDPVRALPGGLDHATAVDTAAAAGAEAARLEERQRQANAQETDAIVKAIDEEAVVRSTRLERAEKDLEEAQTRLVAARTESADEELSDALAARTLDADGAGAAHDAAAASLAAKDPDAVTALLENARNVLGQMRTQKEGLATELTRLAMLLEVKGEAGLREQWDSVLSELDEKRRHKEATDRRAAAADLLYRCLTVQRDQAVQKYVAPLKAAVDGLARIVFGPTTSVEIDPQTLQITTRTLDGTTVPWVSLSSGAREQLSVLLRIACASLVSPGSATEHGGVPVILDDALGWSDPGRLERVGAALSVASGDTQVIVLTCMPDRYRHVGSATVVHLEGPLAGGADDGGE